MIDIDMAVNYNLAGNLSMTTRAGWKAYYRMNGDIDDTLTDVFNIESCEEMYLLKAAMKDQEKQTFNRLTLTLKRLREKGYCRENKASELITGRVLDDNSDIKSSFFYLQLFNAMGIEDEDRIVSFIKRTYDRDPKYMTEKLWPDAIEAVAVKHCPDKVTSSETRNLFKVVEDHEDEIYRYAVFFLIISTLSHMYCVQNRELEIERTANEPETAIELKVKNDERQKKIEEMEKLLRSREAEFEQTLNEKNNYINQLENRIRVLEDRDRAAAAKQRISETKALAEDKEREYRRQICVLTARLDNKQQQLDSTIGDTILKTQPIDFYPGEQKEFLLNLLKQAQKKYAPDTRAYEIAGSLLLANKDVITTGREICRSIDRIMQQEGRLSKADIQELEALGYVYSKGRKHAKLSIGRYAYTLSITASDYRTMLNQAAEIKKSVAVSQKI